MIEEGFRKRGGGGENSPISPPLDPRLSITGIICFLASETDRYKERSCSSNTCVRRSQVTMVTFGSLSGRSGLQLAQRLASVDDIIQQI